MSLQSTAEEVARVLRQHLEVETAKVRECGDTAAFLDVVVNVELPLSDRPRGISVTGVRRQETVEVLIDKAYPWSAPLISLRSDFNRNLPHLILGPASMAPIPCIVDGSLRELFFERGLTGLVERLLDWLERAARGELMDPSQGWEPVFRDVEVGVFEADANALRGLVTIHGGRAILKYDFVRSGDAKNFIFGSVKTDKVKFEAGHSRGLFSAQTNGGVVSGQSVAIEVWSEKTDGGVPFVLENRFAEEIDDLGGLLARAEVLRADRRLRSALSEVDTALRENSLSVPVPVPIIVILCVRRPYNLINSDSPIELQPYVFEADAGSILNRANRVRPIAQVDVVAPALLARISGVGRLPTIAFVGCGSLGSKMALHHAKSGGSVASVCDKGWLHPHHLARHGLVRSGYARKAEALAQELVGIGPKPEVIVEDFLEANHKRVLPDHATALVNTTASLVVREALSTDGAPPGTTLCEAALFGLGRAAFLSIEGPGHNPNPSDLFAEFHREFLSDDRLRNLATGRGSGLHDVQIGQGCSSFTMPMSDARLSTMAGGLSEQLVQSLRHPGSGSLSIAIAAVDDPSVQWRGVSVPAFTAVPIQGTDGWTFRIAERVIVHIKEERRRYPASETGGVLMGRVNQRLKTVTVVDALPAPFDSIRSVEKFILGTQGLRKARDDFFLKSGEALYDVGTWHSHLADTAASEVDWETARELASERALPFALLIATPERLIGIMGSSSG